VKYEQPKYEQAHQRCWCGQWTLRNGTPVDPPDQTKVEVLTGLRVRCVVCSPELLDGRGQQ
jgi:hypothetical protein